MATTIQMTKAYSWCYTCYQAFTGFQQHWHRSFPAVRLPSFMLLKFTCSVDSLSQQVSEGLQQHWHWTHIWGLDFLARSRTREHLDHGSWLRVIQTPTIVVNCHLQGVNHFLSLSTENHYTQLGFKILVVKLLGNYFNLIFFDIMHIQLQWPIHTHKIS